MASQLFGEETGAPSERASERVVGQYGSCDFDAREYSRLLMASHLYRKSNGASSATAGSSREAVPNLEIPTRPELWA